MTDYEVTEAMVRFGGAFIVALGQLFRKADAENRARLKQAFPEYFKQYHDLATWVDRPDTRERP